MRFALTAAILVLALSSPAFAEKIAPGMEFKAVKAVLEKHGYEVNARKYGGAMAADDKNIALDFCPIDANIMLVVGYDRRDSAVMTLDLYFTPDRPTSKTSSVVRRALEIDLEEGGAYTLKLKRQSHKTKIAD